MKRALVTLGVGPHAELLEIALPSFECFASRHGYEVVIPDVTSDRPPSWWKVAALRAALDEFEEALWVDSDIVIVDRTDDVDVPGWAIQAVARHHTGDGEVPNCGVWFVRQPMRDVLDRIWSMTRYVDHVWWEQGAMCELLGYGSWPLEQVEDSELCDQTFFLDNGWNVHRDDRAPVARPRFMHATMWTDRAAVMREWAKEPVAA